MYDNPAPEVTVFSVSTPCEMFREFAGRYYILEEKHLRIKNTC